MLTSDPDVIDERLDALDPGRGSPTWSSLVEIDPVEHARSRTRQKVYLARYARQSVHEWEHREVRELDEYFAELCKMIEGENAMGRAQEDR